MCGRLNLSDLDGIRSLMAQIGMPLFADTAQRFNVAPTASVPVLRHAKPARGAHASISDADSPQWYNDHWGMPIRTASGNALTINARAETASEKPLFKPLVDDGRAVIVASGFYEWQRHGPTRRPFHFSASHAPALLLAGLWRNGQSGHGEVVILTTEANADIADVHHRMPVCLQHNTVQRWLSGELNWDTATAPPNTGILTRCEIASNVNDARHDNADCLDPVTAKPYTPDLFE